MMTKRNNITRSGSAPGRGIWDQLEDIIWGDKLEQKMMVIIPAAAAAFLVWLVYQLVKAIGLGVL